VAATVDLDVRSYVRLVEATTDEQPTADMPLPGPAARTVVLMPDREGVAFDAEWTWTAAEPAWVEVRVIGPGAEVTITGPWSTQSRDDGTWAIGRVTDGATLRAVGRVRGDVTRGAVPIELLPAGSGTVAVRTAARVSLTSREAGVALLADGTFAAPGGLLLQTTPRTEPGPKPTLALAEVGIGLTVGDAEVIGRARLWWTLRQGQLEQVAFRADGLGPDLAVSGPSVASWRRDGDRIVVLLREPETARVELDLSWSATVPAGTEARLRVPTLRPEGAFRVEAGVQIARLDALQIVPELSSAEPVAADQLGAAARDLVEGTPTAAFRAAAPPSGSLSLLRFVPVSGPATLVDVAQWTAAISEDGRMLIRGVLQVRNDRGAFLRIRAPEGLTLLSAQVSGETARVSTDGEGWLLPLAKSVETVEGQLSFPVEVMLLGDSDTLWQRRHASTLSLPRVDAEVAVTRTILHLPPGWTSRLSPGDGPVVRDFDAGDSITYGLGIGDARATEADALFQGAVAAWMTNDFDQAQAELDELAAMGAVNDNVRRLQSNLDLVSNDPEDAPDDTMKRRIREQASARADVDRKAVEEAERMAEEAYLAGDYVGAEDQYQVALKKGKKLEKLEQKESVEQQSANMQLATKLKQASEKKRASAPSPPPSPGALESDVLMAVQQSADASADEDEEDEEDEAELILSDLLVDSMADQIGAVGGLGTRGTGLGGGGSGSGSLGGMAGGVGGPATKDLGAVITMDPISGLGSEQVDPDPVTTESPAGRARPRSADAATGQAAGRSLRLGRGAKSAAPMPTAEPTRPAVRTTVTATTVAAVIPTQGEAVRYQHLLLPAGAPLELPIAARLLRETLR
jgi:hypothetical protein